MTPHACDEGSWYSIVAAFTGLFAFNSWMTAMGEELFPGSTSNPSPAVWTRRGWLWLAVTGVLLAIHFWKWCR